jgi:hypothetical protein
MVDKKISRFKVKCPNGHEIITRKLKNIQCRECASKGKYSRFDIPDREEIEPQTINN